MQSRKLGILGEKIAIKYLRKNGYQILDRNYVNRYLSGPQRGEIDIIARKSDITVFVEVKTAVGNDQAFAPEDRVNFQKQRKIVKAGQSWLMKNKISQDSKWQIDVLGIRVDEVNKKAQIRHFKNIII